jgi:hypothetical protein
VAVAVAAGANGGSISRPRNIIKRERRRLIIH